MFSKLTRPRMEEFVKRFASDVRVLDLGSQGQSEEFKKYFPNMLSLDFDIDRKIDTAPGGQVLPFKDGEFEMVLSNNLIEHVREPQRVVDEMHRILAHGGTLILTTRFMYPLHDTPRDYWRFTKYGLRELFKEWEIVELSAEKQGFGALAVIVQRFAYQMKFVANKPTKFLLFLSASFLNSLNWLIRKQFGDIRQVAVEDAIVVSGYHLVAKKR